MWVRFPPGTVTFSTVANGVYHREMRHFRTLTRNHYRAAVVLAFNYAVHCGYAPTNPALKAAKAKVVAPPPEILTVDETARLREAAPAEILP